MDAVPGQCAGRVVSAYSVFAIVAAIAGAVLTSINVNTEFRATT